MGNKSGFYRVVKTNYSYKTTNGKVKKDRWKYQVKNELLNIEITSNDLLKLKMKVLEAHLNWGIIDLKQAEKTVESLNYSLKDLKGEYGIQI